MPKNDPAYMRDYQRARRSRKVRGGPNAYGDVPYRDKAGDMVLELPSGEDQGGEHYWGHVSKPDTRICAEFNYQGRMIGGCGMVKAWEGRLLSTNLDSEGDLAAAIIESPLAKQIFEKLPATKARER